MAASKKSRGRPRRSEDLKVIYLRKSVQEQWRSRKKALDYEKLTHSAFAEVLLHTCPANKRNASAFIDHLDVSLFEVQNGIVPPYCSTPAKKARREGEKDVSSSLVDVTGTSGMDEWIRGDPFSQTRVGNETNPFVENVDVAVQEVYDDELGFSERLSRIILNLGEDSRSSDDTSDSELDSDLDEICLDPLSTTEPVDAEEAFVIDFDTPKGSIYPDDNADATVTMINPELDKTSYQDRKSVV